MTVKDLILTSIEPIETFYIDNVNTIKQLTNELYEQLADNEIETFYTDLNLKTNQPIIIIKLKVA